MAKADTSVALAVIIGAQGVTGEVRLKLFTDSIDSLKIHKSYNVGALTLKNIRHHKVGAVARFAEITDRNAAEAARGTDITISRADLPDLAEDEYYHADVIGLPSVSSEGEELGKICAIYDYGAGDVIEIERANGKKFMVPVTALDIGDGKAVIDVVFVE
ncbi:ribosome maturation factor RimM [Sphingorhabdus sp. Alg239-R122]|uniref:ribosome maturation factor RimM n=1 Tax=Sphingorhabdus sp. Alg239-R122 TaxID=2305989 RepID=UPI0013DCD1ED|nr:ribosome maturation factor RimM [Sphingorhabdus sp. Alg239-R122]